MSKDVVENKGVEQHQLGLQYNTLYSSVLLEETDLYITQELKKLAEGEAKSAGKKQLCEVREYLHLSPLPDCVVLGTFELCKPQISDVIVDALCGSGAIPLEGAMEWAMSFFLAGDNNGEAVSRSVSNVKHI
ncbi:hypothetical protein DNTS_008757, partial [Danionella cerebrum]